MELDEAMTSAGLSSALCHAVCEVAVDVHNDCIPIDALTSVLVAAGVTARDALRVLRRLVKVRMLGVVTAVQCKSA